MYSPKEQKEFFEKTKNFLGKDLSVVQLQELKDLVVYHEWKYYVQNDPVISDFEYDQLFNKLKELETQNPSLISPDSPTQRVSNDLVDSFPSVRHYEPMLSLANSYNAEDLLDFDKQIKKLTNKETDDDIEYILELKFDGGSISLRYENDLLTQAATRGNGVQGEDISLNVKSLPAIPLRAHFSKYGIHLVEIRGEALIQKNNFLKINQKRAEQGLSLFANPRNAATGGLRMKNPNQTRERGIEAFMYQIAYAVDQNGDNVLNQYKTHFQLLELASSLGFKVPLKEFKLCNNILEAIEYCQEWEEKRESYPYEIDGLVVKVNDLELQEQCGATSHHPRWAIAYKFKAKQATTKLLNVEYQVGKVGSITPVAKLDPVQLAGVTVSSVSLHNEEFIVSKDLRIGDTVLVERAGDVIPYIVKAMADLRDGTEERLEFPRFCPINSSSEEVPLVKEEGEAAWRCPQCVCGAQDLQRIIFHVSKSAMDIDGFGKSIVEKFYDLGWIRDIGDVYNLDYDQIKELEGFGEKSAENLKRAIEKAKSNPIYRLLHSLSIHHLGKRASKLIAERLNHVLDLKNWSLENFTDIKDIGPVVAQNIMEYFSQERNISLLEKMELYGVNLQQTAEDKPLVLSEEAPLAGKSILFTGTLQTMGRKEAQKMAEKAGAKNISAVSSKLDILVVGEKAGSKLKKAQAIDSIQIMTEEEFIKLFD